MENLAALKENLSLAEEELISTRDFHISPFFVVTSKECDELYNISQFEQEQIDIIVDLHSRISKIESITEFTPSEDDFDYNYGEDEEDDDKENWPYNWPLEEDCILFEEEFSQKYEMFRGTYKQCFNMKREILCGFEENGVAYSGISKYGIVNNKEWKKIY